MYRDNRQGCLGGLLQLLMLGWLFDWLQRNFGFGRGPLGCGCGLILLMLFFVLACGTICNTNWFRLFAPMPAF